MTPQTEGVLSLINYSGHIKGKPRTETTLSLIFRREEYVERVQHGSVGLKDAYREKENRRNLEAVYRNIQRDSDGGPFRTSVLSEFKGWDNAQSVVSVWQVH